MVLWPGVLANPKIQIYDFFVFYKKYQKNIYILKTKKIMNVS